MVVGARAQGDVEEKRQDSLAHGLKDIADTDEHQPSAEACPNS